MAADAVIFLFLKYTFPKKEISSVKGFLFSFSGIHSHRRRLLLPPRWGCRTRSSFYFACIFIIIYPICYGSASLPFIGLIMVKRFIYIVAAVLVSCSTGEMPPLPKEKVWFSFALDCGGFTKAVDVNIVEDLNLYLFNSQGALVSHVYTGGAGEVGADIWSGESYSVYAIANAGGPVYVRNCAALMQLSLQLPPIEDGSKVLMTGKLDPQVITGGQKFTIPLVRAVARIILKTDFTALDSDVKIDVKKVSLKNTPLMLHPFAASAFSDPAFFSDGESISDPVGEELQQGIAFYQYENMQGTLLPGNTDQTKKVWPLESNWAKVCSYVELEASYTSDLQEGDIIYRFYLGSDMVSNYDVERNRQYMISVSFKGNGGADETSWRVDNSGLEDVVPPEVSFGRGEVPMYDMEVAELPFSKLDLRGGELEVVSSNPSVVQVLEWNGEYVKVKALVPGEATVVARVKGVSASCSVKVEELRLVPQAASITLFNHFYEDLEYAIYPPHASGLEVKLSTPSTALVAGFGGVSNRIIPQYDKNFSFPVQERVVMSIAGRDDVCAEVSLNVKPMLALHNNVIVNANMGNSVAVKPLGLETSPRADVNYGWVPSDGETIYGTPPSTVAYTDGNIEVQVPTDANGRYRLRVSVVGDDGYGALGTVQEDAVAYCDLLIYETIYLVGVSKTQERERLSVSPDRWKYENEVVAKWFSHPQSLIFPNGEVRLDMNFIYDGVEYSEDHTAFIEEQMFEFIEGEMYEYSMGKDYFVYKGTPPRYYFQYFFLQPASSPYVEGSLPDNIPYIYVCSRNFASGFSNDDIPSWEAVFEYIYPQ